VQWWLKKYFIGCPKIIQQPERAPQVAFLTILWQNTRATNKRFHGAKKFKTFLFIFVIHTNANQIKAEKSIY